MPSPKKVQANRTNALASTGPKTARGKAVASANATRHGILSRELLLPHEDPADFDALLASLIAELGAVGTLECTLVERIAVAIWRQRRLVRAERQDIQAQNDATSVPELAKDKRESKILSMNDHAVVLYQLSFEPYASNLVALERELRMLPIAAQMPFAQYALAFPLTSHLLPAPAEQDASKLYGATTLKEMYGPVEELQAKWIPAILEAQREGARRQAERAAQRAVSTPSNADSLARYQAALDNEWYKAMRAFREARQYRLRTIESPPNCETNPNDEEK